MKKIVWNSPLILSFALVSGLALLLNIVTGGVSNRLVFSVYQGRLSDPLFYVRLIGHVLGHANLQHYTNNMMLFLLVGPLLEEKYGWKQLGIIMLVVALVTGIVHILLDGNHMLLGASGIVFAFILLASVTGTKGSYDIPFTLIIVVILYVGEQVYQGIFVQDGISQLTHIVGGFVGALFGLALQKNMK